MMGGGMGGGMMGGGMGQSAGGGTAVFYNDRNGLLFVRANMQDLDIIEQAIHVLNAIPPQLSISAKFAEFSQDDSRGLGFDWFMGNVLGLDGKGVLSGGTQPSLVGQPSVENSLGVFPSSGGIPAAQPAGSDQKLTNGVRTDGANGTPIPAMATFTGILTNPQFRVVLRAMDQRDGVDVLASPSVTTTSGRQTSLRAVDMRSIVTGSGANQTGAGGGLGGGGIGGGGVNVGGGGAQPLGTTINPQTTTIPEGPMLDVIPYVAADGYSIKMTVLPTLVQFVGYDDPGPFAIIAQGGAGSTVANPLVAQLPLPRLRQRQVLTSVVVWDGQTVVLGGMISEDVSKHKDKVPVLGDIPFVGRLFRSESNFTQKKNLAIFVTPTIIDPAGNRVHDEENLPYDPGTLPTQEEN
jgi:general secretion pathway protein D